jgi:tetratricopeptide (TPR) repeat protein
MLRRLSVTITVTSLWLLCSSIAQADTKKPKLPDKFPQNPLEIIAPDPLIPRSVDKQPLTIEELRTLQPALDELNQQATTQLQSGDRVAAFETWNREIRLRRYFGALAEVQALSRVGAIAWNENDKLQVRYVTERLQSIQKSEKTPNLELLQAIGQGYQKVRSPKLALEVYNQALTLVRQQQDRSAEIETLKTIAEVHLSWFDYQNAAATYEQLLSLASIKGNLQSELAYLQQLAYVYQQAKQVQLSLNTRNKIAQIYQSQNNLTELSGLKLAIASDYESLAKENPSLIKDAFKNYQDAYTTAWQSQQYARAGEALQKLIPLYRSQGQLEEALRATQILVQTEQRAVNFYEMMNAYDQMGQIHLERKDYPQALAAFKKGLELAQQLKHQEAYFTEKIQQASNIRI